MKKITLVAGALIACSALAVAVAAPEPPLSAPGGQAFSTMSGSLTAKDRKFFITDETTHLRMEVRGAMLRKFVGQKVSVVGQLVPANGSLPAFCGP